MAKPKAKNLNYGVRFVGSHSSIVQDVTYEDALTEAQTAAADGETVEVYEDRGKFVLATFYSLDLEDRD